jgi:hypothetical protein
MKQIKMTFHIGTLNHKNNKVCDPDPLICRKSRQTRINFFFAPPAKTGKKADCAVWPA